MTDQTTDWATERVRSVLREYQEKWPVPIDGETWLAVVIAAALIAARREGMEAAAQAVRTSGFGGGITNPIVKAIQALIDRERT